MKVRSQIMIHRTGDHFGQNDRLKIIGHRDANAMHAAINKRHDNEQRPYDGPLAPGTYAKVGGEWRNVRTLGPLDLAHC